MAQKATHYGHCQGCGSRQKLPGGVLSTHGYTVEWGFFQGTCNAAGELPFELSCDYVKTCIISATTQREATLAAAVNYRRDITEPIADFVEVGLGWDSAKRKRITKILRDAVITAVPRELTPDYTATDFCVTFEHNGESETVVLNSNGQPLHYQHQIKTALQAASYLNEKAAKGCDLRADQLESYITWQQGRVDTWKQMPLTGVEAEAAKVGGGDTRLLASLEKAEAPVFVPFYSRGISMTRNGQYSQAMKLEKLGLVKIVENINDGHYKKLGLRVQITEAGRVHLK